MREEIVGGRPQLPKETGDCYSVTKEADGRYLVQHYPDREAKKPCCRIRVTVGDADRAKAIPDADPHGEAAALARVDRAIQEKHAKAVKAPKA